MEKFFSKLSIRAKLNIIIAFIFLAVIAVATVVNVMSERRYILEVAKEQVTDLSYWYFDSLNTMMLTGTMEQRSILREKLLARSQVKEARVVRGEPVSHQYGPGLPEEQAVDELDYKGLQGESSLIVEDTPQGRVMTVVTPFKASENTRGVNCLRCHDVKPGAVNGAIRVSYSLAHMDGNSATETIRNVVTNLVLFWVGMILVNMLLRRWVILPLGKLNHAVSQRGQGDTGIRVELEGNDEFTRLGRAFNTMADNINAANDREHQTAVDLQTKVDAMLEVVNRVTEGDFNARVPFSGNDAIGELASSLQIMIDFINTSIEQKKLAVETLQKKVDDLLLIVTSVADGDLTQNISIGGNDAIAQLAQGVQTMTSRLNELVAQVQRSGVQVTSAATEMAASVKQVELTAEKNALTTGEIATTATEISATSKELLETMDEVAEVAEKASSSAEQSHKGLVRMEELMRQVVEFSSIVSDELEVLSDKATNISDVVTTISRVADQTNLLSLNASIEAEKAGEYGRGFSVVANEIRRLADQSAVATLDIEQMIREMQDAVNSGVRSMGKFAHQLQESVAVVQHVSQEQSEIIDRVETLGPRFELVHKGMHSQSKRAEQINDVMKHLSDAARRTVESLHISSAAIERLNNAAGGLHSSVSRFKVRTKNALFKDGDSGGSS
ncbi:MAG: methyl-accepting chemotaxis protein [Gammaproteobacteria bacterium]|nr:methyl-accepting chemotaxis protein [Gammaproteobacteria bacterium]